MRAFLAALLLLCAVPAAAQELTLLGGATRIDAPRDSTFGLRFDYSHELGDHFAAGFTYGNEGHVPGHHRDGHAVQLWAHTGDLGSGLRFAVGAGPVRYFDTALAENAEGFSNAHGRGILYSAAASWQREASPWFYQLRIDRTRTRQSLDSTMLLAGVGYRLDQDGSFKSNSRDWNEGRNGRDEVTVALGQTIVNSFESQSSAAKAIEYRHAFSPVFRGSLAWINEGDSRLVRRDGLVAQGWLEPTFFDDRLTMGVGYGGYYAVDAYHAERRHFLGVVTTTMSWHITKALLARLSWHRIVSDYDRDSDILLVGLGYRF